MIVEFESAMVNVIDRNMDDRTFLIVNLRNEYVMLFLLKIVNDRKKNWSCDSITGCEVYLDLQCLYKINNIIEIYICI